jgi:predicted DNA-binding transcriptional regulator AlpA
MNIWRLKQALAATGKTRSPFYNDIAHGLMTRPVKLSRRAAGWPSHEVIAINRARIAGSPDDKIRALVEKLHADRQRDDGATDNGE